MALEQSEPKFPSHGLAHIKSKPEHSTLYFSSDETLLESKGHLTIELYQLTGNQDIRTIWVNCTQTPQIMGSNT